MRIGELARAANIRTSKVRFYEARGLIAAARRLENGYRVYDADDLRRVRFIMHAQSLGFTLREVRAYLRSEGIGGRELLRPRLIEKLVELDAQAAKAASRRAALAKLIADLA